MLNCGVAGTRLEIDPIELGRARIGLESDSDGVGDGDATVCG